MLGQWINNTEISVDTDSFDKGQRKDYSDITQLTNTVAEL